MKSNKMLRGLQHKTEAPYLGVVVPGTDKEPAVTIAVRGGTIRYRIISYLLQDIDAITWEGNLEQDVLDDVEAWVHANLPMLLAEAQLHHIIKFDKKSKCYYDFQSHTLYEANGYYEKKGSTAGGLKNAAAINGKPIKIPNSAVPFIEKLTKHPGVGFETESFIDEAVYADDDDEAIVRAKNNLSQAFYKFLRYDSSIKDKFIKENTGDRKFIYLGEPQEWFVGEKIQNEILTVKMIYDAVSQHEILTICDSARGMPTNIVLSKNITAKESLAFIGIDTDLFDNRLIDIKQFFETNYFETAEFLKSLLSRYCVVLDAVWAQIAKNIKNNFLHSLSASTYFIDTEEIPNHQSDYLKTYPLNEDRLGIILKRIYPSVIKLFKDFGFEDDFFKNCDLKIASEDGGVDINKAIDGIVALLLICLYCGQTACVDEELNRLKKRYHGELLRLIHEKFNFIPPSGSRDSLFEALQIGLQDLLALHGQLLSEGQNAKASVIEKFFDDLKLSYNDENSLLPPSMGREL